MKKIFTICFALFFAINQSANAHRVEMFTSTGCYAGQTMVIDATIAAAPGTTWYSWQFKTATGSWTCFVNGINNINGTSFTVSGAKSSNVANNAPALTIAGITTALNNVEVRVLMREGAEPCGAPAGTTWGGGDLALAEAKTLKLKVYATAAECNTTNQGCTGNALIDASGYYGSLENKIYNSGTITFTDNNFLTGTGSSEYSIANASSVFPVASGSGTYQVLNNPYSMNTGNTFVSPNSGNFQMVIHGTANINRKAWFKMVTVLPGHTYDFSVWVARTQGSNSFNIQLKVNNVVIRTDAVPMTIGAWTKISGSYLVPAGVTSLEIAVADVATTSERYYTLDDMCFADNNSNIVLPVKEINLSAALKGNQIELSWQTVNEINVSYFEVERSYNNTHFEKIEKVYTLVPNGGNGNYRITDNSFSQSGDMVMYRIISVDIDGKTSYSAIKTIRLNKQSGISVWPNPFVSEINVAHTADAASVINISILSMDGKRVYTNNFKVNKGKNQLNIQNIAGLESGVYLIEITDKTTLKKFVQKIHK